MRKTIVTVRQDEHKPVPVEVLAQSIKDISAGIRKLREGPLNEKALLLLIQHATPSKGYSGRIGIGEIKNVLDGMESLERTYLKPKAKA